jgi:HK97 family phage prohead protease
MTTTLEERRTREKILDVRETRRMAPLEMRTDRASGHIILEGYASTFHEYDVAGGVRGGGWVERLDKRAFDVTLAGNPDVMLLINHTDMPLARTKSGTLSLRADEHGLLVRADLDPSDPDVQRLMPKMKRGDMDEMSFAFHVRAHDWSSDYTHRVITEVDLRKGDVSVVNYGANPNTAARLTEAVGTLASLSNKELMEVRGLLDSHKASRAMQVLYAATTPAKRASTPKKYADVSNFADPGYLDSAGKPAKEGNGVKRYPLNSAARVRNALARFAQNKGRYSSAQQSAIMSKIKAAAAKFGIEVGDQKALFRAFSTPYAWDPFGENAPIDPHNNQYVKGFAADYDETLGGRPDVTPGADLPGVPVKGGYDAHKEPYGPKQMYALWLLANDEICPGGGMCPGDSCPDHGTEENAMDGIDATHGPITIDDRAFGGKQAKPFKKGGGREGDDDGDDDSDSDERRDDAESDDGEPDDHDHDESEPDNDADDQIDLRLAAALEKTIITCYQMAEVIGDKDIRNMLARARRQVRDLQNIPAKDIDIDIKLGELRAEFGDPETITVSEGLRAIAKSGFADTMRSKAS